MTEKASITPDSGRELVRTIREDIRMERKYGVPLPSYTHRHNAGEVYLSLTDDILVEIEGDSFPAERGDLFFIPPGLNHRIVYRTQEKPYERITVMLLPEYLTRLSSGQCDLANLFEQHDPAPIRISEFEIGRFVLLAGEIEDVQSISLPGDELLLPARATELLVFLHRLQAAHLTPQSDEASDLPVLVSQMLRYIDRHLTEDITTEHMAEQLRHNRSYLSHLFSETMGCTLRQYIIEKRLVVAKSFLEQGADIETACRRSGFHNYSNFIRTFTNNVGISPLRYQKRYGNPLL